MTLGIGMYGATPQMNQTYGTFKQKGSVIQNLENKYGCTDCFEKGPYYEQYPIRVMKVPRKGIKPSFWQKVINTIFGG